MVNETTDRNGTGFDAFYERHWKYVYRLCFTYMRENADAEDCAEDVFVKALTGSFVFEDETHERKWLTVVAANLCKDRLKAHGRRVASMDDEAVSRLAAPERESFDEVTEAVLSLSPKLKDAGWLYYYEGYPTDEIASLLSIPPSTVRNRLRDARKKLRGILEGGMRNG